MNEKQMTPNFTKRYLTRFFLGMGSYMVLLIAAMLLRPAVEAAPEGFLVGLLPVPAVLFIAWAAIRYSREADEFAQRQLTESLAIGFWGGSALVASYGLLDSFGAPALSWLFAFATYMMCWALGAAIVSRRYRS